MRGSTFLPNNSSLSIIAPVSPEPGSVRLISMTPTPICSRAWRSCLITRSGPPQKLIGKTRPTLAGRASPPILRLSWSISALAKFAAIGNGACALLRRLRVEVVAQVLIGGATQQAEDEAARLHCVEHRQFLGDPDRIADRHDRTQQRNLYTVDLAGEMGGRQGRRRGQDPRRIVVL